MSNNNSDSTRDLGGAGGAPPPPPELSKNNSSSAPKDAPADRPKGDTGTRDPAPTLAVRCCQDLLDPPANAELDRVLAMFKGARKVEIGFSLVLCGAFYLWALIAMGIMNFGDNVWGYDDAGCHCVVVNMYIALFFSLPMLAVSPMMPVVFFHDDDAGCHGPHDAGYEDPWLRASAKRVLLMPFKMLALSWLCIPAFIGLAMITVVPLAYLCVYYVLYGVYFCFIFLGTCRAACENDLVMSTGRWGGHLFEAFYTETFSARGWTSPPFPEPTGWGPDNEDPTGDTVFGTRYFVRMVWTWFLVMGAWMMLCDLVLVLRVLKLRRVLLRERYTNPGGSRV